MGAGFYAHESTPFSRQTCQNLYVEPAQAGALSDAIHLPTPGITSVAETVSISSYANRGAGRLNDKLYFVNGPKLYRLNADETVTEIGDIAGASRVFMEENGTQLMILVPSSIGYIYTEAGGLVEITDVDFDEANGVPIALTYIDGYFVCVTDNDRVTVSEIRDGTSWRALDFATAESSPDGLVAPFVYQNQLYIGGTRTIEQFTNIGGADFPFQRTNLFFDKGLVSGHSVVPMGSLVLFIGQGDTETPAVWSLANGELAKVSNFAVDSVLSALTAAERANIFAYGYMERGHHFACFVLPDATYCFDLSSGKWHTRTSRVQGDNNQTIDTRCRVNSVISGYGNLYVGDSRDGRIGKLSSEVGTEYGQPLLREVTASPLQNNRMPFRVPAIELVVENGEPLTVEMDYSRDGGRTWSDPRAREFTQAGYRQRAIWRRLGRFKQSAMFRFKSASSNRIAFMGLFGDIA